MSEDDLESRANRSAGIFLIVVGLILTALAPIFAFTYQQPDMGAIVVAGGVFFLWLLAILFGALSIAFGTAKWQRIVGLVITLVPVAGFLAVFTPFVAGLLPL